MINLHEPYLDFKDKKLINSCIKSGWISNSGEYLKKFENNISKVLNTKYALSFINCTSALQISINLINYNERNEILIPSIGFISPANCILYNRCYPIFMDVDNNYLLDIEKTTNFLKNETYLKYDKIEKKNFCYNKKTSRKISTLLVIHTFGNGVLMDELVKQCNKRNITIIEDAAESLGTRYKEGKYKGRYVGTIGKIGCLSFNGNKIITSGGGGMLLTKSKKIYEKANYLITQAKDDSNFYVHNEIGYNLKLSNLNAALGVSQLDKLKKFIKYKKFIYSYYKQKINKFQNIEFFESPEYVDSNYWLNLIKINKNINLRKVVDIFYKNSIQVRPVWAPLHLQKMLKNYQRYYIEKAPILINKSLCLPSSFTLNKNNLVKIIKILKKIDNE
tara:strand:+ start:1713 stop:2885 length:1173 start_codon:yes stop_codon:yes gene_type:complete